jgi:hypothetical protein
VHDDRVLAAMVSHLLAADVLDVRVTVGRLSAARVAALADALPWATFATAMRAYGLDPAASAVEDDGVRLPSTLAIALRRAAERFAEQVGLRIDACGCPAQCQLDAEQRPAFVSVLTTELFPAA